MYVFIFGVLLFVTAVVLRVLVDRQSKKAEAQLRQSRETNLYLRDVKRAMLDNLVRNKAGDSVRVAAVNRVRVINVLKPFGDKTGDDVKITTKTLKTCCTDLQSYIDEMEKASA